MRSRHRDHITSAQMLITLLIACCLLGGLQSHQLRGAYTIVAPGTIRSNSDYHVSVSLDDFTQSCWFNISLHVFGATLNGNVVTVTVEVEPRTTKRVKMSLPRLLPGQAELQVVGYRGIITRERSAINIEDRQYTVYIQTDKSMYRAGELVQFRMIFLDRLLRPATVAAIIDVNIYDGQGNCIQKLSDIKLVQGVFKGDLLLSEHPVLGEWTIEVSVDGAILKEEFFRVARYVLPTFSVQINAKRDVAVGDGKLLLNVKAFYTFGQPVKGNLSILINSTYTTYRNPAVTLAKEFDGETAISLEYQKDLDITSNSFVKYPSETYRYNVKATVTEALTGQSNSASTDVIVHYQPLQVKVKAQTFFNVHDSVNISVSVTDLDGSPIRDTTTPIHITIRHYGYNMEKLMAVVDIRTFDYRFPPPIERVVYLNDAGVGHIALEIPDEQQFSTYEVKAEYLKSMSDPVLLRRTSIGFLDLEVLTKGAEVGRKINFSITSTDPIDYFIYEIISRGDILHSHRINVPNNDTEYVLSINATHSMVPKITLFVHRIKNGVINPCIVEVYIKGAFENSINITTEKEVLPGASVSLNVTTDRDSYVGLLGIDEKLLIDGDYKTALTEDAIYSDLHDYDSINIGTSIYPGREAGLITLSNARNREGVVIGHPDIIFMGPGSTSSLPDAFQPPSVELPRLRKLFAESWIFDDFEKTPVDGLLLCKTVPDTITSWAITGFSLNPTSGLSLTTNTTKLKVFQPFFISMDLPSLVKEGETVEIPVYVFNYMSEDLLTDVTIENNDGSIDLLESPTFEPRVEPNQTLSKSVPTNGRKKFQFLVRPRKSGPCSVTVKAISRLASDAVQKTLVVESDGVRYSILRTFLVQLTADRQERDDEILVEVPELAVPGSESVHLSVSADIFGLLIKNLQNEVKVPFGNGENNIRNMVSNLLVLKYLKTFNHSNPSLESKARLYLQLGYQTQLSFMQLDGSFGLFDRSVKRTGDIWLSAYTMWTFQQAEQFIQLDQKVIGKGLDYLQSKQVNGEYHSGKDVEEDMALTAFIVITLCVNERQMLYKDAIAKSLAYLYAALDNINHPASLAIAMYALVLGKHEKSSELLAKISANADLKCQQLQWTGPDTVEANLEITTFGFMGLLESRKVSLQTLHPIIRFLVSVETGKRTPAHMLAIEAMIKFAGEINADKNDLNMHFEDDQGGSGEIQVNSSNAQVIQQYELKSSSRRLKLRTSGKGFVLVSVNYKFNLVSENESSSKYQNNVTIKESTEWTSLFEVCTAVKPPLFHINLTAMEINLQSGFTAHEGSFERIRENNVLVKSLEMNESGQSIKVYLENVSQSGTCIQLGGSKTVAVYNLKPISIVVYDAESESDQSVFYHKSDLRKDADQM